MNRLCCLIVLAFAVSGCATSPTDTDPGAAKDEIEERVTGTPACFYQRQVSDFRPLDRGNLIIYAPTKSNAYHVVISPPSSSLRWADTIAFKSRNSRICGYAGERILIDDTGSAREFSVASVYRLDETAHDTLLALYGKGPAAGDMEPKDTTEAEIERDIDAEGEPTD